MRRDETDIVGPCAECGTNAVVGEDVASEIESLRTQLAASEQALEGEKSKYRLRTAEWKDALGQRDNQRKRAERAEHELTNEKTAHRITTHDMQHFRQRAERAEVERDQLRAKLDYVAPFSCHECGRHIKIDEDGCCTMCGADAARDGEVSDG